MGPNLTGKLLIIFGFIMITIGILLIVGGKFGWLGRLPGDISIHKKGFSFYFPITTCIVVSIVLSFIIWLITRR
jgi:hypothetical protein